MSRANSLAEHGQEWIPSFLVSWTFTLLFTCGQQVRYQDLCPLFSEDTISLDHKLRVFHLVTIVWRLSLRTCDSLGCLRGDTLLTLGPSRSSTQLRRAITPQAQVNLLEKRKMKRERPVSPPHHDGDLLLYLHK